MSDTNESGAEPELPVAEAVPEPAIASDAPAALGMARRPLR
jgi:hypothetical protein